ncbi:acetylcholine receptor subunit alpha [Plakobranchus ocellatus]|uniref:Acetylcholine receptor subunit alpha n=1 Tax=Plakobranchus ocellatus TaxID=259542 RepID=A0AAV4DWJ6_9GAST|nr:acetylcholine receptor subunit alpha [Plakobranchus ocellatus]
MSQPRFRNADTIRPNGSSSRTGSRVLILQWNPADYGNTTILYPDRLRVWKPRTMIANTAGKRDIFEDDHHPLLLNSSGYMSWAPGGIFPASCKFNMRKFPFDEQSCSLDVSSIGVCYKI